MVMVCFWKERRNINIFFFFFFFFFVCVLHNYVILNDYPLTALVDNVNSSFPLCLYMTISGGF